MSSRRTEDIHTALFKEILLDSGLNCYRSPPFKSSSSSSLSSVEEKFDEEEIHEEEENEPEFQPEEEQEENESTEAEEQKILLFPTPSLRKLLPSKMRIESQNRIHVLPEEFKFNIDPMAIPNVMNTAPQKYIDVLAEMIGCEEYKSSQAEFWFLDTLANLLRRAQEDLLDKPTQAVLILWWCEWMKEIQDFDEADRPRMMRRFKDNMLSAARYVGVTNYLPTPDQAGVDYKTRDATEVEFESKRFSFQGVSYECSLIDFTMILHYIYDIFSTDFQFDLIRSVFTFPPGCVLIDAPNTMKQPKTMYRPMKMKKPPETKPAKKVVGKKGKKDENPKEDDNEEYLYLLSVKAREKDELEAQAEIDFEQWQRKSHILPLQFATPDDFLDKYWPPPPPEPNPEPEPEPEPTKKKKGKN